MTSSRKPAGVVKTAVIVLSFCCWTVASGKLANVAWSSASPFAPVPAKRNGARPLLVRELTQLVGSVQLNLGSIGAFSATGAGNVKMLQAAVTRMVIARIIVDAG